ncbi:MAG: GDP-mannose 4,6-dehydratase, partial [Pirellulaceae bacterium]|nr:GDP-mannose 4,6-dehydratase [Pirellulaceae bacterium]
MNHVLVTGGAGFIGSCFVRQWLAEEKAGVVNLDRLTYAGNLDSLNAVANDPRHVFRQGDIADSSLVAGLLDEFRPRAVVNLAAESHVDRSIDGPAAFMRTNIMGTFQLLEAALAYWRGL